MQVFSAFHLIINQKRTNVSNIFFPRQIIIFFLHNNHAQIENTRQKMIAVTPFSVVDTLSKELQIA